MERFPLCGGVYAKYENLKIKNMRKSKLLMMTALAMAFSANESWFRNSVEDFEEFPSTEKQKTIPKDCSEYFFVDGKIVSSYYAEIAEFKCIARNEKNAIRKYKNFKSLS